LKIKKIQFSFRIVGLKTWSHLWVQQLTFPFRFLNERDFILACPFDLKVYLVWMGRTHNDVVKMGMISIIEWCMFDGGPCKKGTHNDVELYQDYWQGRWKCNLTYPTQWVDIDSIAC
jgi:hypothetical protein